MRKIMHEEEIALLRRLRDAGCPIQSDEDKTSVRPAPGGLIVRQVGGVTESRAFDLDCRGTGYMLDIEIVSDVPGRVTMCEIMLILPWEDSLFSWLPDPAESAPAESLYRFPGKNPLEYPRQMVINHRTYERGRLRRGDLIRGLLLATSPEPIPDRFHHGASVSAELQIFDQWEQCFHSDVSLWVDRSVRLRRQLSSRRRFLPLQSEVDGQVARAS